MSYAVYQLVCAMFITIFLYKQPASRAPGLDLGKKLSNLLSNHEALN